MHIQIGQAAKILTAGMLIFSAGCSSRVASSEPSPGRSVPGMHADSTPYLTGPRTDRGHRDVVINASANRQYELAQSNGFTRQVGTNEPGTLASMSLFGVIPGGAATDRPDTAENLRQISFAAEGADTDPSIDHQTGRIYFASTAHRTNPDLYFKSPDGRAVTQLTNHPASDIMPAVSPDGKRLAFASDRSGSWDLYVMSTAGGQAVQITSDSTHELHPTWSPDGRSIAYCKLGEVSGRWEIWITDAEQSGVQRFLTVGLFPDWHPASNRIVFQRSRDRGDRLFSIWTLDYHRGEATNLTEIASSPEAALINPKWSPDGEYVAFSSVPNPSSEEIIASNQKPRNADIWIMNVRGGGLANLTGGRFANLMPAWGPGNSVFFVSNRGGTDNIWSANSETAMIAAGFVPAEPVRAEGDLSHPMADPHPSRAAARPGATPAPAQTEPDAPPEMANVPIDDPQH